MSHEPVRPLMGDTEIAAAMREVYRLRRENAALRRLLQQADALYTSYGLLAQSPECGAWITAVRAALAATAGAAPTISPPWPGAERE